MQIIYFFDFVKYNCFIRLCKMRHSLQSWNQDRVIRIVSLWPQDYLQDQGFRFFFPEKFIKTGEKI